MLPEGLLVRCRVQMEEEEEHGGGESARWEVDPEAPAPGDVIGEKATEKRTDYARNSW